MIRFRRFLCFLPLTAGLALFADANPGPSPLIVFRGGEVVDGSGEARRAADVWVEEGRIVRIGPTYDREPDREISVEGLVLAPGFIDTHAHGEPERTPVFENFLRMGVTTIALGQDGSSPFAEDLEAWREAVETTGVAVNVVPFVGHGTVRQRSGVGLNPDPTAADIKRMAEMVAAAMRAGAFGLTTGLEYLPGSFGQLNELVELARPVADAGGLVMSHLRSEDAGDIHEAIDELIEQGALSGSRVHVSHLKIVYGRGREVAEEVLARLDDAASRGIEVTADLYPYTASYTGIAIVFPDWAKPPHDYDEVVRTRRDELADYLRTRIERRNGPEATLFGSGTWRGKTLAQAAAEAGQPFEEVLIEMGPFGASGAYFVMDREVMERFLADPRVMICSDGSPTMLHPRGYGSFARILGYYVRERRLLDLEEAVHRMTGLPARTLRLAETGGGEALPRGQIAEGWAADLVVFDPAAVRDRASFEEPHRYAEGFRHVMVNGRFVIEDGQISDRRPGRVLRMPTP